MTKRKRTRKQSTQPQPEPQPAQPEPPATPQPRPAPKAVRRPLTPNELRLATIIAEIARKAGARIVRPTDKKESPKDDEAK